MKIVDWIVLKLTLNQDLYKVIYVSSYDNLTLFDFYKEVSNSLNLDTKACYKTDMYNNIQKAIKRLVEIDKVQPVIIIDDAHTLSREILKSLKILFDFDMDSKDYTILILIGQDELKEELSKKIEELGEHYTKWNKLGTTREILYDST